MTNDDIVKKWDAMPKQAELEPIIESEALEGDTVEMLKRFMLADDPGYLVSCAGECRKV